MCVFLSVYVSLTAGNQCVKMPPLQKSVCFCPDCVVGHLQTASENLSVCWCCHQRGIDLEVTEKAALWFVSKPREHLQFGIEICTHLEFCVFHCSALKGNLDFIWPSLCFLWHYTREKRVNMSLYWVESLVSLVRSTRLHQCLFTSHQSKTFKFEIKTFFKI